MSPEGWLLVGIALYGIALFVVHALRLREEHRRGYERGYETGKLDGMLAAERVINEVWGDDRPKLYDQEANQGEQQ